MSSFAQQRVVIVRAAGIMEFIRKNGEQSSTQISEQFGVARSTAQTAINQLVRLGKVICYQRMRTTFGVNPAKMYKLGKDTEPVKIPDAPPRKKREEVYRNDISHATVKAVQLGLKRDDMIAAFYGPARGQVAT